MNGVGHITGTKQVTYFRLMFPSLPMNKQDLRSGYLGGIFGCLGALRGAPRVMDGCCSNPGGGEGKKTKRDVKHDRFQVVAPLLTHE